MGITISQCSMHYLPSRIFFSYPSSSIGIMNARAIVHTIESKILWSSIFFILLSLILARIFHKFDLNKDYEFRKSNIEKKYVPSQLVTLYISDSTLMGQFFLHKKWKNKIDLNKFNEFSVGFFTLKDTLTLSLICIK